jgi:hypothetical protein
MATPADAINNPGTHGKEGLIAIKMNAGDQYVAVGNISEWNLSMAKDKVEVTSLGDLNKRFVMGLRDLSGTITAFWDRLSDVLFDASDTDAGCFIQIFPSKTSPQCWEGPAHLDASIKGGVTSAVTIDATFVANGAWTRTSMVMATGATATTVGPGSFTPAGAMPPANLAAMTGITASPNTAWTTGQSVRLGDGSSAYWNGSAWVAGVAAALAA